MPPKSRPGWKTGEQLEFLITNWPTFRRAQDTKTLDQFWDRIFDQWHARWPPPAPSAALSKTHGSSEAARLMLQKDRNTVCHISFSFILALLTRRSSSKSETGSTTVVEASIPRRWGEGTSNSTPTRRENWRRSRPTARTPGPPSNPLSSRAGNNQRRPQHLTTSKIHPKTPRGPPQKHVYLCPSSSRLPRKSSTNFPPQRRRRSILGGRKTERSYTSVSPNSQTRGTVQPSLRSTKGTVLLLIYDEST